MLFWEQAMGQLMCSLVWIHGLVYNKAQPNSTTRQMNGGKQQAAAATLCFWHAFDPVCTASFTAALMGCTQSPHHLCKLSFTWTSEREEETEGGVGEKGRGQLVIFHRKDSTKLTSLSLGPGAVAAAATAAAAPDVQQVGDL